MTITFTLMGLLKFLLYAVAIAAIIVLTVFVAKGTVKLKEVNESIIDIRDDIADVREKLEEYDELADGIVPPVNNICDIMDSRRGVVAKVKDVASEGKDIKKAVDEFKEKDV